jgi:hypothetical protein
MPEKYFEQNGVYYIAVAIGMAVGLFDLLKLPWIINAVILVIAGIGLSLSFKKHLRTMVFSLGFGPFLLQLLALMFNKMPGFKQNLFFSLLALAPSLLGIYGGHFIADKKRGKIVEGTVTEDK